MGGKLKDFFKKEKNIIIGLVILSFLIRLVMFFKTPYQTGNAARNIITAVEILKNPNIIYSLIKVGVFPLYQIILSCFILVLKNPIIVAKTLNLVIGTLSIIPFYLLVKITFDKKIAVWSSLVFVFYLLHVKYSSLALPNILLVFLLLSGLYLFFKHRHKQDKKSLILASVLIGLACIIDFISWLVFLFCLILLMFERKRKEIVTFSLFPLLVISLLVIVMIGIGPIQFENELLNMNRAYHIDKDIEALNSPNINQYFNSILGVENKLLYHTNRILFLFKVISITSNILVIPLGLMGIIYLLVKKKNVPYLILFFIVLSFFVIISEMHLMVLIGVYTNQFHLAYKSMLLSILIIPISITAVSFITKKAERFRLVFLLFLVVLTSWTFFDYHIRLDKNRNNEIIEISEWLNSNVAKNEDAKVLIVDEENSMWTVILYSDLELENFKEAKFIPHLLSFSSDEEAVKLTADKGGNIDKLTEFMEKNKPGYLIYKEWGLDIDEPGPFDFLEGCKKYRAFNAEFGCRYDNPAYTVYKLTY